MNEYWFKPFGWTYRPTSTIGYVITICAIAFVVQVIVAIDRSSHSITDTLYGTYPFVITTFLAWDWIARKSYEVR